MKPHHTKLKVTLHEELLMFLAVQSSRVPIPIFITATLIAGFSSQYLPSYLWGGWLSFAAFMLVIRWHLMRKLPSLNDLAIAKRLHIVTLLNTLHGLLYAASLYAFPYFSELERAVHTVLLLSLCCGAVSTTAGYLPFYLSYAIPVLFTVSGMWALTPGYSENHFIEYIISVLVLLMGAILIATSKDIYKLFGESFEIRLEQVETNKSLEIALKQAEAANRSKTRFLASASHDLRQPIHTLSLFGAALGMEPLNEKSKQITQHMNSALQVLTTQLDSLLDISKLDADVIKTKEKQFNVRKLLQRICREMDELARDKSLGFQFYCPSDYFIKSDEVLLERILRNLISNAIKYTETGEISVNMHDSNRKLRIHIVDSGCGIDAGDLDKIFEEFYQVSNPERNREQGLGLGLSIVKRLTDLLDYKLTVTSTPNKGSDFSLEIPLLISVADNLPTGTNTVDSIQSLNVLVVDDEASVGLGMKTLLENFGCNVIVTDSQVLAIKAAKQSPPDIVLVDLRLRDHENGVDTIRKLREIIPDLPAILITGDTAPDRLKEAFSAGLPLLHKPVIPSELKQSIFQVCHSSGETCHE